MRFLGPACTAAVVVAVIAVERSAAGIGVGLLGAVLGTLVGLLALQLSLLAGAAAFGSRVHRVVLGLGAVVAQWRTPRRSVLLRRFPLLLSVNIGPGRRPVRQRMWAAALCSALGGVAAVAALWLVAAGPLTRGVAIAATAVVGYGLVPQRTPGSTSTGWTLLSLPRLPAAEVTELDAAGLAGDVIAAINAGDLDAADAATERLAEHFPSARGTRSCRVAVLEARGRYAEALAEVLALAADKEQSERDMVFAIAGLASMATTAVEAGVVDADTVLPIARQAVLDAERLGYPGFKLNGTKAVLALLDGDQAAAAALASSEARLTDDALTKADALATLAMARMAAGDNRGAREAVADAERIAAWWPRVAATRARLNVN